MRTPLTATAIKVTITTKAQAVGASDLNSQVFLSTPSGNTGTAYIGGSTVDTTSGFPMAKGTSLGPITIGDLGGLYVIGTKDDILNVLATT